MSIIGVSGYSQSGKDTFGKVIQLVASDTRWAPHMSTSDVINKLPPKFGEWEIKKFAGKLKEVASILTGVPASMFESQELKDTDMPSEWQTQEFPNMKYRDFLQILGTEAIRNYIHPDAWVNALMCDYLPVHHDHAPNGLEYPNWIVTDVRFPNEAKAIKAAGGVIVRVNRITKKPVNSHPSEVALDNWDFDFIVNNDGDIDDLLEPARMLIELKL